MSMLKFVLGIGIPTVVREVSKAIMANKNKREMLQITKDSHEYIDSSIAEIYEKIKNDTAKDIDSIMTVTRFLIFGFIAMFVVLVVFIVIFILHIAN